MDNSALVCILCNKYLEGDTVSVTKGLKSIIAASQIRRDGLDKKLEGKTIIQVHKMCRKNYTRPTSIRAATTSPVESIPSTSTASRRIAEEKFDFKTCCFFCEKNAVIDKKYPVNRRKDIRLVATFEIKEKLLKKCDERNDEWGETVRTHLLTVSDLVAPEARYHKQCHDSFCKTSTSERAIGRPRTDEENFLLLCRTIEQREECQFTLKELQDITADFSGKQNTYSDRHLKNQLKEHFKDRIVMSNISGRKNIICLADTAHHIMDKWYKNRDIDPETERLRIVLAAADIVKEDIQKMAYDHQTYPDIGEIKTGGEKLIPQTLEAFTRRITEKKNVLLTENVNRKCVVINHALISVVRPRSFLSPLHIGLSLTLHRLYGSRHLINMLSSMGICASYHEAMAYNNALTSTGSPTVQEGAFVQHIFDNADVNVRTLDGLNTFHAMGGMQCITPSTKVETNVNVERRSSGSFSNPPESIRLMAYAKKAAHRGLKNIGVKDYEEMKDIMNNFESRLTVFFPLNYIWFSGTNIQPGWNGFMNIINRSKEKCASTYLMAVPFINLEASNYSTIFTALSFAAEESRKQNQSCIVTFDQPLFLKASEIVASAELDSPISRIIVRLGGFHLLMSFMGSLGHIMEDSGLESLWATVYGINTVQNMLNGHSYTRCIRAFMLSASALINILKELDKDVNDSIDILKMHHSQLIQQEISPEEIVVDPKVLNACAKIDESLKRRESSSRTSKLWINFLKCVDLIFQFIYAERAGDWEMHLSTTVKMLPYFHAAGHLPYAKSAHLYAQQMMDINKKLSERELDLFTKRGYFTVRRSGKFWSGTWTDMCIEQGLMRPMKSIGGLTHGRGITESTLSKWVNGTPYFLKVHAALEDFLGSSLTFSDQHVEVRDSRKKRDQLDLEKFISWLQVHNPFTKESGGLVSLSSGLVSDDSVNCDQAYEVGIAAMEKMRGKTFFELKLHRKDKIQTQAKPKMVKIRSKEVKINPQQLFNRILCICDSPLKLKYYLSYELAPRPPSLFDDISLRKGKKSSLMKIFENGLETNLVYVQNAAFVLDGGFLIHYLRWPKDCTYGIIVNKYCEYVVTTYGDNVTVIFDGYPEYSTIKNEEQSRRASKQNSSVIHFEDNTKCTTPKENFLGNKINKKRLLQAVATEMARRHISTLTAEDDADVDIVSVAIEKLKENSKVVVVGTDTDLLTLLVALAPEKKEIYFCKQKGGKDPIKQFYNVNRLIEQYSKIRRNLLFVHALTGCDTTSCFYGIGKVKAVEMLKSSEEAQLQASIFTQKDSDKEQLLHNGELFALRLYGINKHTNLNEARHFKFMSLAKKSNLRSNFDLVKLPPTTEACQQHLLRVFLQVQKWLGNDLPATEWGWKLEAVKENGGEKKVLQPVPSLKPFAPDELLQLVSCSCKTACGNYCGCRKAGLLCSPMCEYCSGYSCHNAPAMDDDQDELDDVIA